MPLKMAMETICTLADIFLGFRIVAWVAILGIILFLLVTAQISRVREQKLLFYNKKVAVSTFLVAWMLGVTLALPDILRDEGLCM